MWVPRENLTISVLVSESPGNTCTIILLLTVSGKPRTDSAHTDWGQLGWRAAKGKMTQHLCNWLPESWQSAA